MGSKVPANPVSNRRRTQKRPSAQTQATPSPAPKASPSTLGELHASLRTGAATVAGVTFQVAVSTMLLAAGLADPDLPVVSVMPERLEDIDCRLADGTVLLVQAKEHGTDARATAAAALADILTHAALAVRLTIDDGTPVRLAIVTNGKFGSGLPATGWNTTLTDVLRSAAESDSTSLLDEMAETLEAKLEEAGLGHIAPMEILSRTHLVAVDYDLGSHTRQLLAKGLSMRPVVADILRMSLLADLGALASAQREKAIETAGTRTLTDLRVVANRIVEIVDAEALDEAVTAGICEPVDFMISSPNSPAEFFAGVAVKPGHIVADLDITRQAETVAVLRGLSDRCEVVIAGPSGAGKSCLLWRAARLLDHGPQLLRVKSVADRAEAAMLLRHVRRMMPEPGLRVLICIDDLGTPATAAWPDCRDELLQISGVSIIGAVRHENAAPGVTGNAVIVDPRLTDTSASDIYDALAASGLPTTLAKEEALASADGLLMEFIALTTTGQRIRAILGQQVARLSEQATRLPQRLLRLICASHTLGFAVRADEIARTLNQDAEDVQDALRLLQDEHLALSADQITWQGVHDLRAEILLELLHTPPPPILPETYVQAIGLMPPAAQGAALRRAAHRIATSARHHGSHLPTAKLLSEIETALLPFVSYIANALATLSSEDANPARTAAALLESADRLDTLAYAHATLPLVQHQAPAAAEIHDWHWLSRLTRTGWGAELAHFEPMRELGALMPDLGNSAIRHVAQALPGDRLADLLANTDLPTAVRLAEAAEGLISLTPEQARNVYRAHVPALPKPAGDQLELDGATLRGKITAALVALSQLSGAAIADVFGPIEERAADATAHDPYGAMVTVEQTDDPAPQDADSADQMPSSRLTIRAALFMRQDLVLRDDGSAATTAGAETTNTQLVKIARRLFDSCPEADRLALDLWQANRRPPEIDGTKDLRPSALPRDSITRRNVTMQQWPSKRSAQKAGAYAVVNRRSPLPNYWP